MERIITGATGLIGKRLVEHWLSENHKITVIGRTIEHIQEVFGTRVKAITWDELTVDAFKIAEVVVNLAGASIGDKRWTKARKQEILMSRVEATKKIASFLAVLGKNSPLLLNASAIGIYGLQEEVSAGLPKRLDESNPIDSEHPTDFLSKVAREWEKSADLAVASGVRVIFMRFGVVLAKEGGALPKLKQPFQFFLGGPLGRGRQPFTWVAIDDLIAAIDFLLSKPTLFGPINIVSPECIIQREFAEILGRVMQRPALFPMPAFLLSLLLGKEMATELLLKGQHVYPQRLLDLDFRFKYAYLEAALSHELNNK